MKKIVALLALILAPALSFAQTNAQQNEAGSTFLPSAGQISSNIAVDRALRQIVSLSAGTASATNPIKLEDSAMTDGDAVMVAGAVRNEGSSAFAGSNLDYSFFGVNRFGSIYADISEDHQISSTSGLLKLEDAVVSSGSSGVPTFSKLQAALTADAADGDYGTLKGDLSGRLITANAPSGELLQGCNVAITTVTTGTIINATASKFNFMTGFTCTNTGVAATRVIIEDGDGVDLATANLAGTTGYATATFPGSGIKTNAVNKSIQVNVLTTGSSTVCCVSGFVGTN
jgi:hypothetical protein